MEHRAGARRADRRVTPSELASILALVVIATALALVTRSESLVQALTALV